MRSKDMKGELEREGQYVLFETNHGNQILNLNDKVFFAIVSGQKGDILVKTDSDHKKKKDIQQGKFYLVDFDDDPEFRDMPHLFLEEGDKFREWILPNDEATKRDHQKKLVKTGNLVSKEKVNYHVKGSGKKGSEKQYKGTDRYAESRKAVKRGDTTNKKTKSKKGSTGIEKKSKKELYELAKKKEVSGRSKMSKSELVEALR